MNKVIFVLLFIFTQIRAETMIYRIRVVTQKGTRFETITCMPPESYIAYHGGESVIAKVYTIKRWLEKKPITSEYWQRILKKERLYPANYIKLPDIKIR